MCACFHHLKKISQPFVIFRAFQDCATFVLWMIYFALFSDPANACYSEKGGNE
jgi:hypothetical protein